MKVIDLSKQNSAMGLFIAQIRDKKIQKDRMRFRENLRRVGSVFAYEISKTLSYSVKEIRTPLATAEVPTYDDKIVAATILRAGIPLHQGVLDVFDGAESAFVAACRMYDSDGEFIVHNEYCTCPDLTGKTLVLVDSMMATGSSFEVALEVLRERGGEPARIHLVCPIASVQGVEYLKKKLGSNVTLWVAAQDPELTNKSFIIPGLGDAGDLAYGEKI